MVSEYQQLEKNHKRNTEALKKSGIPFEIALREVYQIREGISADFYPHTGRWKQNDTEKIYDGGALAFIGWYRKKVKNG